MSPIPAQVKAILAKDPLMTRCVICDDVRVEWDHVISGLGRRQLQEWWAIAPVCTYHHRGKGRTQVVKDTVELWCLVRGAKELHKFPKHNLEQRKKYLTNKLYGNHA